MKLLSLAAIAALSLTVLATGDASAQGYGYGYQQAPAGSYQQSCNNVRVGGGMLSASCTNNRGQRVRSSLAYGACNGADIGNINGQLSCVRAGNGYGRGHGHRGNRRHHDDNDNENGNENGNGNYNGNSDGYNRGLPAGSYRQSCNNASMNGNTLSANCRNDSGAMMTSYLDVSQCRSTDDIGNLNGQLRCIYRR